MKKITIIVLFLLTSACLYPQTREEVEARNKEFNSEFGKVYGKDHRKTLELLDELTAYYQKVPDSLKTDETATRCQLNYLYCETYSALKEYDKAAVYVKKMQQGSCRQLTAVLSGDQSEELRKQQDVREIYEQIKNSVPYKIEVLTEKIGASFTKKEYRNSIGHLHEALVLYDSLESKNPNYLCWFQMMLSMSYSAQNNTLEALNYLEKAVASGCDYNQYIYLEQFDNIRQTKEFAELFRDTTLTAPALKPGAWGIGKVIPVKVSSAKASNEQRGEGVAHSIDGDMNTVYHSSWSNTVFPVELTYTFDQPEEIDYMFYCPRTDGINGNFKEIEVYAGEGGRETLVGKYNFNGKGTPSLIYLEGRKPGCVKVRVQSGAGHTPNGFASCAEMQFFRQNKTSGVPGIFTDATCSALKAGISESDIGAIVNPPFKALAQSLLNDTYDKRRVREYFPYPQPTTVAANNRTGTYSLLDNATGIVAMPGEEIVVFVGETGGQNITLRSINFNNDYSPVDYTLLEGANTITCHDGGLLYIMYHTDDKEAKPIKIHIASGKVNGIYRAGENTPSDWQGILNKAQHKYLDVQGKYAHLIFPVADFRRYTPDISRLLQVHDSIVYLESRFMGLEKYGRMNGNRLLLHVSTSEYWMYATANRTGYNAGAIPALCQANRLRTDQIWGPAHEIGHINQTRGLKWVGLTEVSNNIYAMYIQAMFGNKSRLSEERLNSDFDGVWSNRYEKGFTQMLANKVLHSDHADVFCKLIPFWQLQLYFSHVKGYTDFYADVHEQLRLRDPQLPDDDRQQLNFMWICCHVTKTDLSEFFERWGLLAVTSGSATDHSSIQNKVNYTRHFNITEADVAAFKQLAAQYPKPDARLWYLHDECVETFRSNATLQPGRLTVDGTNCIVEAGNAVVYEVYDGNKLVLITPASRFKVPGDLKNWNVYAVPAIGTPVKLTVTSTKQK